MTDLVDLIESGAVERPQDDDIRVYTCSHCHERGHSKRTCPQLGRQRAPRHKKATP